MQSRTTSACLRQVRATKGSVVGARKQARGLLGERLEYLFEHVNSPDGVAYRSMRRLAEQVARRGVQTSREYLSALRTGQRRNPTIQIVDALADVFGVPIEVFTEDPSPAFDAIVDFVDREGRRLNVDEVRAIIATITLFDALPERDQMLFRGWKRMSQDEQNTLLKLLGNVAAPDSAQTAE
jgi:transcriptional regulator with XRE-family HTH domain